eukprot:m.18492 g.18492  ORF g.18492 m.18492 type:complete len:847 (+) comp10820_c0_seq2:53-2593(+)
MSASSGDEDEVALRYFQDDTIVKPFFCSYYSQKFGTGEEIECQYTDSCECLECEDPNYWILENYMETRKQMNTLWDEDRSLPEIRQEVMKLRQEFGTFLAAACKKSTPSQTLVESLETYLAQVPRLQLHGRVKTDGGYGIVQEPVLALKGGPSDQSVTIVTGTNSSGKSLLLDILAQHERTTSSPQHSGVLYRKAPIVPSEWNPALQKQVFYFTRNEADCADPNPKGENQLDCDTQRFEHFRFATCEPHASMLSCPVIQKSVNTVSSSTHSKCKTPTKSGRETSRRHADKFGRLELTSNSSALHNFCQLIMTRGSKQVTGLSREPQPAHASKQVSGEPQQEVGSGFGILQKAVQLLSNASYTIFGQYVSLVHVNNQNKGSLKSFFMVHTDETVSRILSPRKDSDFKPPVKYNELQCEGSGMRSAIAILFHFALVLLYAEDDKLDAGKVVFLLDEPEVFLHPEQCRRLAKAMMTMMADQDVRIHMIVSTHSSDFINDLCLRKPADTDSAILIQFLRLQVAAGDAGKSEAQIEGAQVEERKDHYTPVVSMSLCNLSTFMGQVEDQRSTALNLFTKVIDGMFFERVVVVEAPTDAYVYKLLWELHAKTYADKYYPIPLFVPINGKSLHKAVRNFYLTSKVVFTVVMDLDAVQDLILVKPDANDMRFNPKQRLRWHKAAEQILHPRMKKIKKPNGDISYQPVSMRALPKSLKSEQLNVLLSVSDSDPTITIVEGDLEKVISEISNQSVTKKMTTRKRLSIAVEAIYDQSQNYATTHTLPARILKSLCDLSTQWAGRTTTEFHEHTFSSLRSKGLLIDRPTSLTSDEVVSPADVLSFRERLATSPEIDDRE